ncbi:hypothetical protein [Myxococcus faecalis]|uniref:hypothetical protein n=1 Tax=Myxococcus faecalis TaxID=3115646 RepID=UPI003CF49598
MELQSEGALEQLDLPMMLSLECRRIDVIREFEAIAPGPAAGEREVHPISLCTIRGLFFFGSIPHLCFSLEQPAPDGTMTSNHADPCPPRSPHSLNKVAIVRPSNPG